MANIIVEREQASYDSGLMPFDIEDLKNSYDRIGIGSSIENETPLQFFNLPPEVRNKIYSLVFLGHHATIHKRAATNTQLVTVSSAPNHWRHLGNADYTHCDGYGKCPSSLLFANRKVRNEALRYLYQETTFQFRSQGQVWKFLQNLPDFAYCLIQYLDLELNQSHKRRRKDRALMRLCIELPRKLGHLKRISVTYWPSDWGYEFENARCWLESFVHLGSSHFKDVEIVLCCFTDDSFGEDWEWTPPEQPFGFERQRQRRHREPAETEFVAEIEFLTELHVWLNKVQGSMPGKVDDERCGIRGRSIGNLFFTPVFNLKDNTEGSSDVEVNSEPEVWPVSASTSDDGQWDSDPPY